jgi:hypothetical protein
LRRSSIGDGEFYVTFCRAPRCPVKEAEDIAMPVDAARIEFVRHANVLEFTRQLESEKDFLRRRMLLSLLLEHQAKAPALRV